MTFAPFSAARLLRRSRQISSNLRAGVLFVPCGSVVRHSAVTRANPLVRLRTVRVRRARDVRSLGARKNEGQGGEDCAHIRMQAQASVRTRVRASCAGDGCLAESAGRGLGGTEAGTNPRPLPSYQMFCFSAFCSPESRSVRHNIHHDYWLCLLALSRR